MYSEYSKYILQSVISVKRGTCFMRSCQKWMSVLLSLTLLFSACLVGCAKKNVSSDIDQAELMNMANQIVSNDLGQAVGSPRGWTVHKGRLWVVGHQPGDVPDLAQRQLWAASANTDGTNITTMQLISDPDPTLAQQRDTLAGENPDITYTLSRALSAVLFDSADRPHFVLYEVLTGQPSNAGYAQTEMIQFSLCRAAADGVLQRQALLQFPQGLDPVGLFPNWYHLTGDGALWMYVHGMADGKTTGALLRFSTLDGSCTARFDVTNVSAPKYMSDGNLLMVAPGSQSDYSFYTLTEPDGEDPAFTEIAPVNTTAEIRGFIQPLDGLPKDEILLQSADGALWYDLAAGKAERLMRWNAYGVPDGDATLALYYYPRGATTQLLRVDGKNQLGLLSVFDPAVLESLPTITVGLLGNIDDDAIYEAVHAYNVSGHDHYIKVVEYVDGDQLAQDIATHTGPDIVMARAGIDFDGLCRKGFFIDMYPYLDADPQLSRDDLLPNILQVTEVNGTLPTMIGAFMVSTVVASRELVGPDMGWTLDEYAALMEKYPDSRAFYNTQRSHALMDLLFVAGDQFIDKQSGQASLDSPAFVQLLEMTAGYSTTDRTEDIYLQVGQLDWSQPDIASQQLSALMAQLDPKPAFSTRQALLKADYIGDFRTILVHEYEFDGPVTYIGYPTSTGQTGAMVSPMLRFGISSTCAAPQAAWDFARTLLLPAWQNTVMQHNYLILPVRRDTLQAMADEAMKPLSVGEVDLAGIMPEYLRNGATEKQKEYWGKAVTQAQVDQVMAVLYAADTIYNFDVPLQNIIFEEADYFYNGVRTAKEAAAIMQNRVQTYLNEKE